ncbi:MAG TPA: hypothetical protein VJ508_11850, partial [Saprospiraceae bacterium]|nr:hypothetical protein [Saprospiraceae bacterium]
GPAVLCPGQNATLTAQENPGYYFLWNTGEQTISIDISAPGLYSVTVSNFAGCFGTDTLEVLPGSAPPEISAPMVLCNGQSGTIEITNSSSYTDFLWSTGETTSSIIINAPGTYSVTVTAIGGCTATGSVTVNSGNSNITLDGNISPVTSCVVQNGAVDITVTPSGTYSYTWSNGSSTQDISNLATGTYTVTVTDTGGCSSSSSYIVDSNIVMPSTTSVLTSTTCDLNNGAVDLSVIPPGSYTFIWSNGAITEDLANIIAGSYTVTVTSTSSGCDVIASFTITNNNLTITISGNTIPLTSCSLPNGAIDITPSPSGTYAYLWSNGGSTEDLSNLSTGSYTVTVSTGSCASSATYIIDNNIVAPVPVVTPVAATCGQSNGAIDLNVTPAGAYSYIWSNGSTAEDLTSIPGGTYSVTVTSIDGCTATTSTTVPDISIPFVITGSSIPNTLCVGQNGAIDITVSPSGSYSFLWSNGATTEDLNALPPGSYSVTATLGLTCNTNDTFIVDNNIPAVAITGVITDNTSCSDPNGTIDITLDPTGSYTYAWSNGETTEDLQQLTGGFYSVTVTGNNGCTATSSFEIINTSSAYSITESILPNTSCTIPNGSIDLTVSPAGTYSFSWSTGASTEDLQNLPAGQYGVTVADINNCLIVASYAIEDALTYPQISALVTPSTCGNNNGAIDISVIPVSGNNFIWSNGSSAEDQTNLAAGNYSVTVTRSNGCMAVDSITVDNQQMNFTVSAVSMPNNSCVNPNGSIDLSVTPAGTYSFLWTNGNTNEDLLNMDAGIYAVTITDIFNCTTSDTFTISSSISSPLLSVAITPSVCGAQNGAIDLTISPPFNNAILWSTGAISEDLQNLGPGAYSVSVVDSSGCETLDTFSVPNLNNNFSLSALTVPNTSCSNPNGTIDLTVTPGGTYTYSWSNGAITEDLFSLATGSFTVTVTDSTQCLSTAVFDVLDNTLPITVASIITPSSCGQQNGMIDITPDPSIGNVFLWSNGEITEDLVNLLPGNYS